MMTWKDLTIVASSAVHFMMWNSDTLKEDSQLFLLSPTSKRFEQKTCHVLVWWHSEITLGHSSINELCLTCLQISSFTNSLLLHVCIQCRAAFQPITWLAAALQKCTEVDILLTLLSNIGIFWHKNYIDSSVNLRHLHYLHHFFTSCFITNWPHLAQVFRWDILWCMQLFCLLFIFL
jgi:hypothetical protein